MKILFADLEHTKRCVPYGAGMVAAYAKWHLGCEVEIFKYPREFEHALEWTIPEIVCFSSYTWNTNLTIAYAEKVRRKYPIAKIFFGGSNKIDDPNWIGGEGELNLVDRIDGKSSNRIEIYLDNLPSPYLSGLLDKFLAQGMIPLLETTRGCPFTCTYCQEAGHKVRHYSVERIKAEIEYIAARSKNGTLQVADSNFGMYEKDLEICQFIGDLQKRTGWPTFFSGIAGKNNKARLIEATKLVKNSITGASVQSLNPAVQKNIRRENVDIATLMEVARETPKSYSELILGLPGDTKKAHIDGMCVLIAAGLETVRSHQFMMLPEAEASSTESRKKFGYITKWRVMFGTVRYYEFGGELFIAPEMDEIVVASKTMTFQDYLDCRLFDLTVEIFHNSGLLRPASADKLLLIHDYLVKQSPHLTEIYEGFLRETKELFDSPEDIYKSFKQPGVVQQYLDGKMGNNEQMLYSRMALENHREEIIHIVEKSNHPQQWFPYPMIEDKRPAKAGWAPGECFRLCRTCGRHFIGDKRAMACADCAYKPLRSALFSKWRIFALGKEIACREEYISRPARKDAESKR